MKRKMNKLAAVLLCFILTAQSVFPVFAAEMNVLLGDADTNGDISAADARIALRLSVGLENSNPNIIKICDVDSNGKADAADARLILRASVGLENFNGKTVTLTIADAPETGDRDTTIFTLPAPAAPVVAAGHDTFTFTVYGNGHGVGMSQWGAVYMSNAGYNYAEILGYYFPGSYIALDPTYHPTVFYNGTEWPVYEIVAAITSMEIGGIAADDDAIKAQAVAVYTLFKYYNYNGNSNNIGVAGNFSRCSDKLKNAVASVIGQYVTLGSDPYASPVMTVYSAFHAGASISSGYAWGSGSIYPMAVRSPFEYLLAGQIGVYRYSESGSRSFEVIDGYGDHVTSPQGEYFALVYIYPRSYIEQKIKNYYPGVTLGADPATWFDIVEHSCSIDSNRGYVRNILVGDMMLTGVGKLSSALGLGFRSGCYTVTYNR